jgi:hypothetical protein
MREKVRREKVRREKGENRVENIELGGVEKTMTNWIIK